MKLLHISLLLLLFVLLSCAKQELSESTPKIIAHKGFWKSADGADNSILALKRAAQLNVYGVELDICRTIDDSLVVAHGPKHGNHVTSETNFEGLRAVRLPNGELIPTLREYLLAFIELNTPMNLVVELKQNGTEEAVLKLLDIYGLIDRCQIISANWEQCKHVSLSYPQLVVGYLGGDKSPEELSQFGIKCMDYQIENYKKHNEWIREAKNMGILTNVWTVNSELELIWAVNKHFDYITTDIPLVAKQFYGSL